MILLFILKCTDVNRTKKAMLMEWLFTYTKIKQKRSQKSFVLYKIRWLDINEEIAYREVLSCTKKYGKKYWKICIQG
jgi:hypothetical protein